MNTIRAIYNGVAWFWLELRKNLAVLYSGKSPEELPTYTDLDTRFSTQHNEAMAASLKTPIEASSKSTITPTPLVLASGESPSSIKAIARREQQQQNLPNSQTWEARAASKYKTRPEGYWDKESSRKPGEWLQKTPPRRPPPEPARLEPPRSLSKTVTSKVLPFLMDEWSHPVIQAEYAARKDKREERVSYRHYQRLLSMNLNALRRSVKDNEEAVFEMEEEEEPVKEDPAEKRRRSSSFSDSSMDSDLA